MLVQSNQASGNQERILRGEIPRDEDGGRFVSYNGFWLTNDEYIVTTYFLRTHDKESLTNSEIRDKLIEISGDRYKISYVGLVQMLRCIRGLEPKVFDLPQNNQTSFYQSVYDLLFPNVSLI